MSEEKKVKFRVQYSRVGLTYSRCPLHKEDFLHMIKDLSYNVEFYCIAQETHKEEKDCPTHIHMYIEFETKKPNITNERYFDYKGYHPHIQRKNRSWIGYITKQDKDPLTNIPQGYNDVAIDGDVPRALELFRHAHPKEFAMNLDRLKVNFQMMSKKEKKYHIYPWEDFTFPVPEYDDTKKSLIIIGPGNLGKTQWAKSYVHSLGKTFLYATHMDSLKKYRNEDYIIFDDMSFHHLNLRDHRQTLLAMFEIEDDRDIHARYKCAEIPAGTKKIFLANKWICAYRMNTFNDSYDSSMPVDEAFEKRMHVVIAPSIRFYKERNQHSSD